MEELPPNQNTNVTQTALSTVTLGLFSKELWKFEWNQCERFRQDICIMEERYQGFWDVNFLADYCWCLKRDAGAAEHRRMSL